MLDDIDAWILLICWLLVATFGVEPVSATMLLPVYQERVCVCARALHTYTEKERFQMMMMVRTPQKHRSSGFPKRCSFSSLWRR